MSLSQRATSVWKWCISFFPFAFVMYVGTVATLLTFAPIVHHFSMTVDVVDRTTRERIAGAKVSWAQTSNTYEDELGVTGTDGRLQFQELIQENPTWMWPTIGVFRFHRRVLRVKSPGYETAEIVLAKALPGVRYANPVAHLDVELEPDAASPPNK